MDAKILAALLALNPDNDEHWNRNGSPRVRVVQDAAGDPTLTREDLDELAHDLTRDSFDDWASEHRPPDHAKDGVTVSEESPAETDQTAETDAAADGTYGADAETPQAPERPPTAEALVAEVMRGMPDDPLDATDYLGRCVEDIDTIARAYRDACAQLSRDHAQMSKAYAPPAQSVEDRFNEGQALDKARRAKERAERAAALEAIRETGAREALANIQQVVRPGKLSQRVAQLAREERLLHEAKQQEGS